ncbi:hypothetical protein Anacy_2660 [Anabaena cylindrica PCC 7122]|uniref:Uncharacterized protein n=1 Tax=Anabaena cylindrica (strain ATCC 27899 / PCC 7122) TaxID=272123 RepID=K9ZH66_ANACC|nr:hypothetical protein Anacy_2660 [Anabaena cylindrica PCC 7122]BAY04933.1 hypothetical protein NIES19_42010 [Anabaena cylindrica PCC 7122]
MNREGAKSAKEEGRREKEGKSIDTNFGGYT